MSLVEKRFIKNSKTKISDLNTENIQYFQSCISSAEFPVNCTYIYRAQSSKQINASAF